MEVWNRFVADKPHYPGPFDEVRTIRSMLGFAASVARS
jgi:hypothetical protein